MTRECAASPWGTCVLHVWKMLHFKHWLKEAGCFLCATALSWYQLQYSCWFFMEVVEDLENHKNNPNTWNVFIMSAFQSHPSCSWLVFIPVFVPLHKPVLLMTEPCSIWLEKCSNTILGLVTEFRANLIWEKGENVYWRR